MALRILIRTEYGKEKILRFEERPGCVRFGRALENEVVLSGPYVSRHHGEFVFEDGHWAVVDGGSLTGTILCSPTDPAREQHLASRRSDPLQGGEEVRILDIVMRIELEPEVPRPAPLTPADSQVKRVAEERMSNAASLEHDLFDDRAKLERVLELAKDLNRLEQLDDVLRRISSAVFEALPRATHFTLCVRDPSGNCTPRFGMLRDGAELVLSTIEARLLSMT